MISGLIPAVFGITGGLVVVPAIAFVGSHNVGKTTVLEKVISSLQGRGLKVGVIKHAFHPIVFEEGDKDSLRLFNAGAAVMAVVSDEISVEYRRLEGKMALAEVIEKMAPGLDIVLTEGFKHEDLPKVQVLRRDLNCRPMELEQTVAIVADFDLEGSQVPVFHPNDIENITDFIVNFCVLGGPGERSKSGNG